MERDPAQFAWIHFLSSSAAVRVWPKVSCLPVESAIAIDDQCVLGGVRRIDATACWPRCLRHSAA